MPDPHSVDKITRILSSIIKKELRQEISVTGKVSVDNRPRVFWLTDGTNKIRCFISGGNRAQFGPLLKAGNTVVVNGTIALFPSESEYQIRVANVLPIAKVPKINQQSVSGITKDLSSLLQKSGDLQGIQVRGDISNLDLKPKRAFWFLSDTNIVNPQRIHCVFYDPDGIAVSNGDQVRAEGDIQIFGTWSRYQIKVTHIKPDDSAEGCQCSGCAQCTSPGHQCNRPREVANFESCTTCLPRPPDELYKLCSECYEISPDRETKVAKAVYDYFNKLEVNGFSPYIHIRNARSECKECQIQFGARNGIADVVLADRNGSFAAISECKGAGYVGQGIEQLKSYLCATDTRFGIFANRADPEHWEFYENRRRNRFDKIDRSEFEAGVVERIANREQLREEIENLKDEIAGLENQKSELHTAIERVSQTKHELTECTSNLTQHIEALENYKTKLIAAVEQLTQTAHNLNESTSDLTQQIEALENYKSGLNEETHRKLNELLEEKIQRLERPLADLKVELQKRGIKNRFKNLFSKENK